MLLRQITDRHLAQNAYLIGCQQTGEALIVDPQRDVDRYLELAASEGLRLVAATETHIHADFLSGVRQLAEKHDVHAWLSDEGDADWKYGWAAALGDRATLLHDGDTLWIGKIEVRALHTPGHTPEHLSFLVIDHGGGANEPMGILSGDFMFVGDLGRPDLLESAAGIAGMMRPSAERLFDSLARVSDLADYVQVWPGHGAGSACGKALGAIPTSTLGYERAHSPALHMAAAGRERFVEYILEGQPEPPLYFARMKRWNRDGVPVLDALPQPERLSVDALMRRAADENAFILDTRGDRKTFMEGHLPGSLFAPVGMDFSTAAGSYIDEEPIYLVADPADVESAVRDLVRIGLDEVVGYVDPAELANAELAGIPISDMAHVERERRESHNLVLDVRRLSEFEQGHVPEALNVAHTRLRARLDEVPRDRKLLVHCRSGHRAALASAYLRREGFEVTYVDDFFSNWKPSEQTESSPA